jgi:hypothetical protein
MLRAYRLYTGSDGNSHVERGSVGSGALVEAESILFKKTPAYSSFDWHNDPIPQYVLTLAGILEFTTKGGETFTIHPGDVLLAVDHIGSGHKWRLIMMSRGSARTSFSRKAPIPSSCRIQWRKPND